MTGMNELKLEGPADAEFRPMRETARGFAKRTIAALLLQHCDAVPDSG